MSAQLYAVDMFGQSTAPKASGVVAQRFGFPPFTVLDARSGEWQERKRAWLAIGIRSEEGRSAPPGGSAMVCGYDADGNRLTGKKVSSKSYNIHGRIEDNLTSIGISGSVNGDSTSIFDPVLCEMAYRWFCPEGGQIVDPFAGGSVRGIVAGAMGFDYWGCDLRAEQIAANNAQADAIETERRPVWVCGDSMDTMANAPAADFVFSCPPYGDLEVYSDDPNDLSTMEWHTFVAAYKRIILRSVQRLKNDRFACFVVGDFRDPKGFYRDFVSTTIRAFEECGARLYNEAILATSVGSAGMRVTKQFDASRKMAKTHQNVLVFCKGDPRKAAAACKAAT